MVRKAFYREEDSEEDRAPSSDAPEEPSDGEYGTRPTPPKKRKPKSASAKKKTEKNPRKKISPSKTPASKRKYAAAAPRAVGRPRKDVSYTDDIDSDHFNNPSSDSENESESEEDAPAPPRPRGRPSLGSPKSKKPSPKKSNHPPVGEMIVDCIKALKANPKKGSTLSSIKETIGMNWTVNMKLYDSKIKKALTKGIDSGDIIRVKGKGFRGRFSVPGMKIRKKKRKVKAEKEDVDENAEEYVPQSTERDAERKRNQAELEEQRLKRQLEEERRAAEKAARPKRPVPKRINYEVEAIKGMRERNGSTLYLVKFEGWKKPQWEPEDNVEGCQDLIDQYLVEEEKRKLELSQKKEEVVEDGNYEVHRIIDVKFSKKDQSREFLIRWKGCTPADDTWEPEENLNCVDLIDKFMIKWEKLADIDEKSLRVAPKKVARLAFCSSGRVSKRNNGFRPTYEDMDE